MSKWISTVFLCCACLSMQAQSYWFGPKLGTGLAFQKWVDFDPNGLLAFNGDLFIESYDEASPSSIYAQLGLHQRGSSLRSFTWQGESIGLQGFKFNNLVLELGMKRTIETKSSFIPYYLLAIRGEYTLWTNLKNYERFNSFYYPNDVFVRKLVYGPTLGGGFIWTKYSDVYQPFLEVTFNPDFANQYYQETIPNVVDQFGNTITLRERAIRNLTLEIKVGVKLLRKVIYVD